MNDEIIAGIVDKSLRNLHPEYIGFVRTENDITWIGYTPSASELGQLEQLAAEYILQAEQYKQAIYQAVEATRPLDLVAFMTADQAAIDQYISDNGINTAVYSIIRVLQYLTACKDRAKIG